MRTCIYDMWLEGTDQLPEKKSVRKEKNHHSLFPAQRLLIAGAAACQVGVLKIDASSCLLYTHFRQSPGRGGGGHKEVAKGTRSQRTKRGKLNGWIKRVKKGECEQGKEGKKERKL